MAKKRKSKYIIVVHNVFLVWTFLTSELIVWNNVLKPLLVYTLSLGQITDILMKAVTFVQWCIKPQ